MNEDQTQKENPTVWEVANHANRHLMREITKEKLSLSSLSAYGTSGISFVAILAMVQMEHLQLSQMIAFAVFSFAIPILLFIAVLHESFTWYGDISYIEYKKMVRTKGFYYFLISGYCLFGLGFFLLVWSVSVVVALITIFMTIILLFTHNVVTSRISDNLDIQLSEQTEEN
jgi:hypothetical protein